MREKTKRNWLQSARNNYKGWRTICDALPEHIKGIANRHGRQELALIALLTHIVHQDVRSQTESDTHHLGLWQLLPQVLDNPPDILRISTREQLRRGDLSIGTSTGVKDNTAVAIDLGDMVNKSANVGFVTAAGQSVEEN